MNPIKPHPGSIHTSVIARSPGDEAIPSVGGFLRRASPPDPNEGSPLPQGEGQGEGIFELCTAPAHPCARRIRPSMDINLEP
jgi:hypothetical protein